MLADRVAAIRERFFTRAREKWWLWLLVSFAVWIVNDRVVGSINQSLDGLGVPEVIGAVLSPLALPALVLAVTFAIVLLLAYRDTRQLSETPQASIGVPLGSDTQQVMPGAGFMVRVDGSMSWIEPWAYRLGAARLLRKLYLVTHEREIASLDPEAIARVQAPKDWADSIYREIGLPREPSYDVEQVLARKDEHERENAAQAARHAAPSVSPRPSANVEQQADRTCRSQDGKVIRDGDRTTLTLQHGTSERVVTGTIRAFAQDGETRWEILTGDPQRPAIGFLPEHVITRIDVPGDSITSVAGDPNLIEAACSIGGLLWDLYGDHPIGSGQEKADQLLRDKLREWETLVRKALGDNPDRERFDAPVNTSGMDHRIQVAKEQLRVKLEILRDIARERAVRC
jgi:hypothetical protein